MDMPMRRVTHTTRTLMNPDMLTRRRVTVTTATTGTGITTAGIGHVSTVPTISRLTRSVKLGRGREGEGSLFGAASLSLQMGRGPLHPSQSIERALKNEHGGVLIDHGCTSFAADVGIDQLALYRCG